MLKMDRMKDTYVWKDSNFFFLFSLFFFFFFALVVHQNLVYSESFRDPISLLMLLSLLDVPARLIFPSFREHSYLDI